MLTCKQANTADVVSYKIPVLDAAGMHVRSTSGDSDGMFRSSYMK
jgi:hypothetical protein